MAAAEEAANNLMQELKTKLLGLPKKVQSLPLYRAVVRCDAYLAVPALLPATADCMKSMLA